MRLYAAIDLKSFYASVECVERGLDPLKTNLVVADVSRTEKTICLAVSPSLKAYGIGGRARLFQVVERLQEVNRDRLYNSPQGILTGKSVDDDVLKAHAELAVDYVAAPPRMAYYMDYSSRIYKIYLRFVAPEDIHVYSIDEVFIDVTDYLKTYRCTAHELVRRMISAVLAETGITATAGIGTNLYLAKVAMDIVAKHIPADKDGVRIAQLDEESYRRQLWSHRPLRDFWRVGRGISAKLEANGMYTMGDVARRSLTDENLLYSLFGVAAELLIDHAWGWEPCTMEYIKSYRPTEHSFSMGQVLPEPYSFKKARVVVQEMAESIALRLVKHHMVSDQLALGVGFDATHRYANTTARLPRQTSSARLITKSLLEIFDRIVGTDQLVRRINISTNHIVDEKKAKENVPQRQLDLFVDAQQQERERKAEEESLAREHKMQCVTLEIKKKYGKNALLRGTDFEEGATARERNKQIGGHHE